MKSSPLILSLALLVTPVLGAEAFRPPPTHPAKHQPRRQHDFRRRHRPRRPHRGKMMGIVESDIKDIQLGIRAHARRGGSCEKIGR